MANYSPKNVIAIFKGIDLTGFAEDDMIEAERSEDGISLEVGCNGDVVFDENANISGKVKVSLLNSSLANTLLAALVAQRERFPGTQPDKGELLIKDLGGTMLCHAAEARPVRVPNIKRGKKLGQTDWVFLCARLEMDPGAQS